MNFIITIYENAKLGNEIKCYCKTYEEALIIREKLENKNDVIIIDPISKYGRFIIHQKLLEELNHIIKERENENGRKDN